MQRPFSFSDRQLFIQNLAATRNLAIACAVGEHPEAELRKRCEALRSAIDAVVGELVGDAAYLEVHDYPKRA